VPEGSINIIAVLKDVLVGICDVGAPETAEVASKRVLIKHWWEFVRIGNVGLGDVSVG
jgi:hypothetical protein